MAHTITYACTVAHTPTQLSNTPPHPPQVTAGGKQYAAKFAVVTVPVGVLKAGKISFSPALPAAKTKAIKSLGMGVLNKVCWAGGRAVRFATPNPPPEPRMRPARASPFAIMRRPLPHLR